MILGRITGSVVSTIHHSIVDNHRLLLAERLDQSGEATGDYVIALDVVGAGYGETVLILDEGNGARQVLDNDRAPIRSVIVGIVDELSLGST
jgi:microcompartment protein CcmK/EutM